MSQPVRIPGARCALRRRAGRPPRARRRRAAVLMEVVLALVLFFGGSLIVLAGLNSSLRLAQRTKLEAEAADLAVTLLSEIQMGLLAPSDDGPNAFEDDEDLADWTWEIYTETVEEDDPLLELPEFLRVEIIISHTPSGYAHRLVQWMTEDEGMPPEGDQAGEEGFGDDAGAMDFPGGGGRGGGP